MRPLNGTHVNTICGFKSIVETSAVAVTVDLSMSHLI